MYVLTSRTPEELNFMCVGVPPKDIFVEVMNQVIAFSKKLRALSEELEQSNLSDNEKRREIGKRIREVKRKCGIDVLHDSPEESRKCAAELVRYVRAALKHQAGQWT